MDFLKAGGKIPHLLKDEIAHELSIRNLDFNPDSRRDSLRKILTHTSKFARRGSIKFKGLMSADVESELQICSQKISEIEKEISETEGVSAVAVIRLGSRLRYLLCRVSRLPETSETKSLSLRISSTLSNLMNDEETPVSDSCSEDDDTDSDEQLDNTKVVTKKIFVRSERHLNLNSLNLKYKGTTCARTFTTRLEELRKARKISEEAIYTGFPELLEGPALDWFRANRSHLNSYKEVVKTLLVDFDIPDLDFKLLQEIRSRTQAKTETIVIFLSTVLGMFERLNKTISDEEKLDILTRNIRPEYSKELALHDITTIDQLKDLCKRIELAKARADNFKEPVIATTTLKNTNTKYSAYKYPRSNPVKGPKTWTPQVATVDSSTAPKKDCFRCGRSNHSTRLCRSSRDIVCFKCGEKGVKVPDCTKCNPKN